MDINKKLQQFFASILTTVMLFAVISVSMVAVNATTLEFAGGSGTEADPYLIETKEHLNNVRNHLDAHYKMIADIAFSDDDFAEDGVFYNQGKGWLPIGTGTSNAFAGTFDGAKHTIKGLQINIISSQTEYAGLFGFTRNAKISNIVLVNVDVYVKGRYACVGGVAGYTMSTRFNGCESSGTIESSDEAGGVVGYVQGGSITNCHNNATVISSNSGGGIVGATDVAVTKCSNAGDISSIDGSIVGGIVGYLYSSGSVTLSYNIGNISAIENRVKQGSPTTFAGGICGESSGEIRNCYNAGTIYAEDAARYAFAGGIAGSGNVYNCYNAGDVSASASATYYVGAGGIVGDFEQATENSYYVNTCSKSSGRGTNSAIKCTPEDLCDSDTFAGFDFNTIWEFADGNCYKYPTLKNNSNYIWIIDKQNDCGTSGQKHQECIICGVKKNENTMIPATGNHTYDNACDATCNICQATRETEPHKYDNTCDESCNICGNTRTIAHNYDDATCNAPKTCKVCGITSGKALGHKYNSGKVTEAATCKATGVKAYTCSECNVTKTETIAKLTTHTYSNNCDKSCNVCGKTRTVGAHKYSDSCDTTCNYCNAKRTIKHTYTNACDTTCNICKAKRTIKHTYSNNCDTSCNVCKATRTITHTYKTTTTKATLTKNGSIVKKCTVCGKVASNTAIKYVKTFKLSTTAYTYNGGVKTPSVTLKDSDGKTLKKNTDYTVTYASGRKNAGTYKVTVKMMGKYSGTKTLYFKINPAKLSSYKLSATVYTYDGKAKTPSVTVKNASGMKLTKNTHYTVTYASGRKNVGTYKVTIKGKGNYTGTKTLTFKINPAKTTVSKLAAGKKSITATIVKKSTQVTGYQIQYSTSKKFTNAKTKTISSYKSTKYTLKSLSAKKTYYIRVRTYKTVGKTKYYSCWSTYKYVKTK